MSRTLANRIMPSKEELRKEFVELWAGIVSYYSDVNNPIIPIFDLKTKLIGDKRYINHCPYCEYYEHDFCKECVLLSVYMGCCDGLYQRLREITNIGYQFGCTREEVIDLCQKILQMGSKP